MGARLGSLAAIAEHLGVEPPIGGSVRLRRRDDVSPMVELTWDDARGLLLLRAPLEVDVGRLEACALVVAISEINLGLEVFGIECEDGLAFVSHVFVDDDGTIPATALERLLVAADDCAARTHAYFEAPATSDG